MHVAYERARAFAEGRLPASMLSHADLARGAAEALARKDVATSFAAAIEASIRIEDAGGIERATRLAEEMDGPAGGTSRHAVVLLDMDARLLRASPRLLALAGIPIAEATGRPARDLVGDSWASALDRALRGRVSWGEGEVGEKGPRFLYVLAPVFDGNGTRSVVGCCAIGVESPANGAGSG